MGLSIYLVVRDGDGLPEDDPLHDFATRWGGQGTRVAVIAAQGGRQEVPQNERIQKGLLLCVGEEAKEKHTVKSQHAAGTQAAPPQAFCLFTSLDARAFGGGGATENKAGFPGVCSEAPVLQNKFHEGQHWATLRSLPRPPRTWTVNIIIWSYRKAMSLILFHPNLSQSLSTMEPVSLLILRK